MGLSTVHWRHVCKQQSKQRMEFSTQSSLEVVPDNDVNIIVRKPDLAGHSANAVASLCFT